MSEEKELCWECEKNPTEDNAVESSGYCPTLCEVCGSCSGCDGSC